MSDVGTFKTTMLIESAERRGDTRAVEGALGARSREGMNLRVDAARKRLVSAGPVLAGAA